MKPLIAVTTWKRDLPTFWDQHSNLYTLSEHYVDALRAAGAVPLLLAQPDAEDCGQIIDVVDGLLLTGGGDIDPRSYGVANEGLSRDMAPRSDAAEMALITGAQLRRMPTLGICRGMQMLNVALGGSMHQHITTEGGPHGPEPTDYDAIKRHGHDVTIVEGSRLHGLYKTTERFVNSYHHQAIDRVAEVFDVTARSAVGIVEGIEHTGAWDCMGVQWHPEKTLDDADDVLFESFVEAVRASASVAST